MGIAAQAIDKLKADKATLQTQNATLQTQNTALQTQLTTLQGQAANAAPQYDAADIADINSVLGTTGGTATGGGTPTGGTTSGTTAGGGTGNTPVNSTNLAFAGGVLVGPYDRQDGLHDLGTGGHRGPGCHRVAPGGNLQRPTGLPVQR